MFGDERVRTYRVEMLYDLDGYRHVEAVVTSPNTRQPIVSVAEAYAIMANTEPIPSKAADVRKCVVERVYTRRTGELRLLYEREAHDPNLGNETHDPPAKIAGALLTELKSWKLDDDHRY